MSQPILSAKITLTTPRPGLVERPRLLAELDKLVKERQLILLTAPAGSGKTSLLGQWANQAWLAVAWFSLDEYDNDPARFWRYVLAALEKCWPDLNSLAALNYLENGQPFDPITWLAMLEQSWAAAPGECALVLDDFQVITNPAILQTLNLWLEHLTPKVRLVLASRNEPALDLPRRRVRQQVGELAVSQLNFTRPETALFLGQTMQLDLAETAIDQLAVKTEGWVAGLQIAALALQTHPDLSHDFYNSWDSLNSNLFDYLAQEIFERLPPPIQNFLLQTALPDYFSSEFAADLTELGLELTQEKLVFLEKQHLFLIPLPGKTYRYYQLWADFLRHRLSLQQPELRQKLLLKIANRYEKKRLYSEAIHYGLAARNYPQVVALIEQEIEPALSRNQLLTLQGWIEALPKEFPAKIPKLQLAYSWTLALGGQVERANFELEKLADNDGLAAEILALRVVIANLQGMPGKALEYAQQALENLAANHFYYTVLALMVGIAYQFSGRLNLAEATLLKALATAKATNNLHLVLTSQSYLAELEVNKGNLHKAYKVYQEALELIEQNPQTPLRGMIYYGLANLWLEWNELEKAAEYLDNSLKSAQPYENQSALALVYCAKAQLALAQNNPLLAEELTDKAVKLVQPAFLMRGRVEAWQARLHLATGQFNKAFSWLQANSEASWLPDAQSYEFFTAIRIELAQNKLTEAADKLDKIIPKLEAGGLKHHLLEALLLQSVILYRLKNFSGAQQSLQQTLKLAEQGGYLRVLLEFSKEINSLWQAVAGSLGTDETFRQRLLNLLAITPQHVENITLLSERELAVLHLLAAGCSNQEIAERLVISRGTVKTHLNHIYEKLATHSRTQAVAKARALKLL